MQDEVTKHITTKLPMHDEATQHLLYVWLHQVATIMGDMAECCLLHTTLFYHLIHFKCYVVCDNILLDT